MMMALSSLLELIGFAFISIPVLTFLKAHLVLSEIEKKSSHAVKKISSIVSEAERQDALFPSKTEIMIVAIGVGLNFLGLLIKSYYYVDRFMNKI